MVCSGRSVLGLFTFILDGEALYVSCMVRSAGKFTFTFTSLSYYLCYNNRLKYGAVASYCLGIISLHFLIMCANSRRSQNIDTLTHLNCGIR